MTTAIIDRFPGMWVSRVTRNMLKSHMGNILELDKGVPAVKWSSDNFIDDSYPLKYELSLLVFDYCELVGYSIASKKSESTVHIHRFCVKDSYKGQGLGSFIFDTVVKLGISRGFEYVSTKCRLDNEEGKIFFKSRWMREHSRDEHDILFKVRI